MGRTMRAIAQKWFGETDQFIDTDDLIKLLRRLATNGIDSTEAASAVIEEDHDEWADVVLHEAAATRFLELLDDPVELSRVASAGDELTVDAEGLSALLNNLHIDRAEYRKAYELDGDVLRLRLDY